MDPQPYSRTVSFENGFFYSQDPYGGFPGTARDGGEAWHRGRTFVSDKGTASNGSSGGASPLMVAGGAIAGMSGGLGVVLSHLGVYWFAGSGNAVVSGSSIGTSTGKLCLVVGGVTYSAGLTKPSTAPTLATSATASGIQVGSYAISLVKYRSTTGAVSTRGPISAPIAVNKHKITVPLPSNPADGTTHWLIYATRKNFAGLGIVFRVTTIDPIAVGTTSIDIEFQDGDLGDAAPLTNDPAPTCTHCAVLGGVMVAITSGGMCYPSKAGQPEAYDYGLAVRLASGEAPTCVIPQGVEGGVFVGTRNSVSILVLTGSPDVPVIPRGVFAQTGVANGNAMCWAWDTLWLMSSTGVPCRSHGSDEPDSSFAEPVVKLFEDLGFTAANTIVVADEKNGAILFCSGSKAVPFMVNSGRWSTPITLPGSVSAGIAFNGAGNVAVGSTLYTLNSSSAPAATAFLTSPSDGADGRILTIDQFRAVGPHDATIDLLADMGSSIGGYFPLSFTAPHGNPKVLKMNRKARSLAMKASTSQAGKQFPIGFISGTVEPGIH